MKNGSKFLNPVPTHLGGLSTILKALPRFLMGRAQRAPSTPLGPFQTDPSVYIRPPATGLRITWFGHSSLLLEIDGFTILIDPVWDERASPFAWMGPKRFFDPTISLANLPKLNVVLISHDHYDHLGESTIRALASQPDLGDTQWITSKNVGALLHRWGVPRAKILELDWTESYRTSLGKDDLKITAWPARHFSGRKLSNRFETLWSSFAIEGNSHKIFYGADSGPWPGFSDIGQHHGRFDLIMLEIGAYDPLWADIHLGPDAAVDAFAAMNAGGLFLPIHWGLFDLALHGWTQPIERLEYLAAERNIPLWLPEPGRPTEVQLGVEVRSDWWRKPSDVSV